MDATTPGRSRSASLEMSERMQKRRISVRGLKHEEKAWAVRQTGVFTRWLNLKCRDHPQYREVTSLFDDLRDGLVLHVLLESLSGETLPKVRVGKLRVQHIDAMNVNFEYLTTNLDLLNIGVLDIVDGTPKITLGLLWHIMVFFLLRELGAKL